MENIYKQNVQQYNNESQSLQQKVNNITILRFASFIASILCVYFTFKQNNYFLIVPAVFCLVLFFILIKYNDKLIAKKNKAKLLQQINEKEVAFLQTNLSPYYNGQEFANNHHLYTNDVDVFGPHSLYAYLNRTATVMGQAQLANLLKNKNNEATVTANQLAINTLTNDVGFRQNVLAMAQLGNDDKQKFEKITNWCNEVEKPIPLWMRVVMIVLPIVMLILILLYNVTSLPLGWPITYLFIANTLMFSKYGKQLFKIVGGTDKVHNTIKQYGNIIAAIERLQSNSPHIKLLQQQLQYNGVQASAALAKLSTIINNIESIQNLFGAFIVNGLSFFHLHQLKAFANWKKNYASQLQQWLQVIGNVEALNSIANFKANNPTYVFPSFSANNQYSFQQLGHPLIAKQKRICNNWQLNEQNFVILSGSNMSGKSTFLRTIGVNLILANAGAPVCATKAEIGNATLVTCMRLNDSLEENASYFFAEVKRLQQIVNANKNEKCFVILDEILRGTNSDDKQQGTIKVLQKLMQLNATGIVATHDVEVCNWGVKQGETIQLQCFESEIANNELLFDYKLYQGICKNKSATFLLQKNGVI